MEFLQTLINELYDGIYTVDSFDSDFIYFSDCCGSYSVSVIDIMEASYKKIDCNEEIF